MTWCTLPVMLKMVEVGRVTGGGVMYRVCCPSLEANIKVNQVTQMNPSPCFYFT